jgi:hypothetical protein
MQVGGGVGWNLHRRGLREVQWTIWTLAHVQLAFRRQ